jgi:glycosyltransferase involved in cell wall biosynthesis
MEEKRSKMENNRLTGRKIAYILGGFPILSETFILEELRELEMQGVPLHIFSLFKLKAVKGAQATWNMSAPVTPIADYPTLFLVLCATRCFLQSPLRFIRTSIAMVGHFRLRFLIGCRVLLFASFLARQFKQENIRHMHAHFAWEASYVAQFTHLLTGIPYSFTAHAEDIYIPPKASLAYRIKMARFVVASTVFNQDYMRTLVDQETGTRIHQIYSGINLQYFPSFTEESAPQIPPLILAVCRLVEKKGLIYLLEACHILANQGYTFSCQIIGDGPLRQELEEQIRALGLSDRVILLGARSNKEVLEIYPKATLMALPCVISKDGDRDGLPTVLMEALYAGIPSVSTTVTGNPELIESEVNGLLVPPNNSTALATALARLLDDSSLRARFAAAGHQTVLERFNAARNVRRLRDLFYAEKD